MKFSPEELVQLSCVDFTRVMCPDVLLIASMNGMYIRGNERGKIANYVAKLKKLGMVPGDLDLRLHWKNHQNEYEPVTAYVELKAGNNEPTDAQLKMMDKLDGMGIANGWTNDLIGYYQLLLKFGAPMRSGYYMGIGQVGYPQSPVDESKKF